MSNIERLRKNLFGLDQRNSLNQDELSEMIIQSLNTDEGYSLVKPISYFRLPSFKDLTGYDSVRDVTNVEDILRAYQLAQTWVNELSGDDNDYVPYQAVSEFTNFAKSLVGMPSITREFKLGWCDDRGASVLNETKIKNQEYLGFTLYFYAYQQLNNQKLLTYFEDSINSYVSIKLGDNQIKTDILKVKDGVYQFSFDLPSNTTAAKKEYKVSLTLYDPVYEYKSTIDFNITQSETAVKLVLAEKSKIPQTDDDDVLELVTVIEDSNYFIINSNNTIEISDSLSSNLIDSEKTYYIIPINSNNTLYTNNYLGSNVIKISKTQDKYFTISEELKLQTLSCYNTDGPESDFLWNEFTILHEGHDIVCYELNIKPASINKKMIWRDSDNPTTTQLSFDWLGNKFYTYLSQSNAKEHSTSITVLDNNNEILSSGEANITINDLMASAMIIKIFDNDFTNDLSISATLTKEGEDKPVNYKFSIQPRSQDGNATINFNLDSISFGQMYSINITSGSKSFSITFNRKKGKVSHYEVCEKPEFNLMEPNKTKITKLVVYEFYDNSIKNPDPIDVTNKLVNNEFIGSPSDEIESDYYYEPNDISLEIGGKKYTIPNVNIKFKI